MILYKILQDPKECRGYLEFLDPPGCHWVPLGPPGLPLGFPGPSQLLLPLACFSCLLLGSSMASPRLSWLHLIPMAHLCVTEASLGSQGFPWFLGFAWFSRACWLLGTLWRPRKTLADPSSPCVPLALPRLPYSRKPKGSLNEFLSLF